MAENLRCSRTMDNHAGADTNAPAVAGIDRFDGVLPTTWDADIAASLDTWKQGDLVSGCPMFWAGPAGRDRVIGTPGAPAPGVGAPWDVIELPVDSGGFAIITSQTCDIAATGPGARHAFVDVSPVFEVALSENEWDAIESFQKIDCVALTNPPLDGKWICDLRISFPVSKGLLVEQGRLDWWTGERDRLNFSHAVAFKKLRPAVHDSIPGPFTASLEEHLRTGPRAKPEWKDHVEQVRVRLDGDRLHPRSVGLVVVEEVQLSEEQRNLWRAWDKQAKKILARDNIGYLPTLFMGINDISARTYRESIHLRLTPLARRVVW